MIIRLCQHNFHIFDLLIFSAALTILIYILLPHRFALNYDYIKKERMEEAFLAITTPNISSQQAVDCSYKETIADSKFVYDAFHREKILRGEEIRLGGEYQPDDCRARYSTAIIVPYRDRQEQLAAFLNYMHNYLRLQQIHYRIFVVEQSDRKPFNRAMLFNIGATVASSYGYPCLILHDVDLMPLNSGQLYACTTLPRHMSSALDNWRFHLPYRTLFGGVVAISTSQFKMINGMSNLYHGWGGEDDDLYERLHVLSIEICRFAPAYSEYTMLKHKQETPNKNRMALLRSASLRMHTDGLNSLVYKEVERKMHSLFTLILVET
ncbi:PREDICTED: beta-1,4-N-acetylgalactosaminyltransferase bre-4 [Drosophila arizonae]|uniref:Beta-1,4-N-acetylgalactosaminyltransferase bre-4 n=1 Tax=Drosophila arizonae TaxID=7263 RepID=A0ABM1Q117_DROAR|nr:PREDICTED: beta-1,4-N-acetylgalactosaminyltransferase bre-4 [Drosophila arizonae]